MPAGGNFAHAERDRHHMTFGGGREFGDAVGEALLDPLQHEAIRRQQAIAVVSRLDGAAAGSRC